MRPKRVLAAGVVAVLAWPVSAAAATGEAPAAPGVCQGVGRCHVVAHVDVDGDGSRDAVGLARRGADGAEHGAVIIRVRTAPGSIESLRRPTAYWHGPLWQGAANLDGRHGKDLVVGRTTGAHAQLFQVIAWQHGGLRFLEAPGKGKFWPIDGAVWVDAGWKTRHTDPAGVVRKRVATRGGNPTKGRFHGRVITFRWTDRGWHPTHARRVHRMSPKHAARWGGWRVPGVRRW